MSLTGRLAPTIAAPQLTPLIHPLQVHGRSLMLCEVPKATAAGAPPPPPRVYSRTRMRGIYTSTPVGGDPGYAQPYGDYFTDSYERIWS